MRFMRSVLFALLVFLIFPDLLLAGDSDRLSTNPPGVKTATFGAGCFWCVEAVFLDLAGVTRVVSGYSGGTVKNPTYREVCDGSTGHAEVVQVIINRQR
jgi:peptide-methionine (S)-S-oxide reductase